MAWLRMSLRRLRIDRVPTLGLLALVFATAFVFTLGRGSWSGSPTRPCGPR